MSKSVTGIYAALTTPRFPSGELNEAALAHNLEFLLRKGIKGFALNGATGEYHTTSATELTHILALARRVCPSQIQILCGIGAATLHQSLDLGELASAHNAQALLLPPPHFFFYEQEDLFAFYTEAAGRLPLPVLLYNLPFTSHLEAATVQGLIAVPNIVGIKDSSGSLDILRSLTAHSAQTCRIVGSDSVYADALSEGLCDGVVSGVAGVVPELIQTLPNAPKHLLEEFIAQIDRFPVPWGLKWIAEARGLAQANFAQPISAHRLQQARDLQRWFLQWEKETEMLGSPRPAAAT